LAFLRLEKEDCPGQIVELTGERLIIGRHPNCEIVLDNGAVSRYHAQILVSHGHYFLEDLRSRNRTLLNDEALEGRVELNDKDSIKVCDIEFFFYKHLPPLEESDTKEHIVTSIYIQDQSEEPAPAEEEEDVGLPESDTSQSGKVLSGDNKKEDKEDKEDHSSSIITTMNAKADSRLSSNVQSDAKLRAVLDISNVLARILDLDEVLTATLQGLFEIFPQSHEGFILLKDSHKNKLVVKATLSRKDEEEETKVKISMTIVKQAMQTGEAILSADAIQDSRFEMSDSLSQLQIRSVMCTPILLKSGDIIGVIQIDSNDLERTFSENDLDTFTSVSSQVSLAIDNATMHEELLRQRDLQRELDFATQVQLGFLPNKRPKIENYEFFDYYEAALRVGGDYFDYIIMPQGKVAIALGDVAGKGVPAALLMARLYSSARFHLLTQPDLKLALEGLNSEIASSGLGHRFITFVAVVIDPAKNQATVVNAGHLPPLIRNKNGVSPLINKDQSGMPLGISPHQEFQEAIVDLEPGDTICLYTDGVTDAMNPDNEIFGRKRLNQFILDGPGDIEKLINGIVADIEKFSQDRPHTDDICAVGIKRSSPAQE
jgi:phosphoserine phosphatase RsbU/P